MQAHDGAREVVRPDRQVELAVGDREAEGDAPLEARDERADQRAIDRVQLQSLAAVNLFAGKLLQKLRRGLVSVDGDAARGL
jgi:hypothetical protein